ncbi:MAG: alpha/beta fold hydrolase [Aquabacterium sp.]|nr:MAG: alpha/beta fold hydrolase [Aquabacterium sp.]
MSALLDQTPTGPEPPAGLHYDAPLWLRGPQAWAGNLQTIWAAKFCRKHGIEAPRYRRERWTAPDGDFVDVDWLDDAPVGPAGERALLVLFHGLEGASDSHYSLAFADWARARGWAFAVPHFRGCSGEINLAPRAYHSGDYEEVGWILERMRARHRGPIVAVGISLGGNALLRWAQEAGDTASRIVRGVASICAPLDLAACGEAIGRGFNRQVYTRMFLRSMKPRALQRLALHPGLFDREALLAAGDLYEFDNLFTAPLHGFRDTDDYWDRASAKPHLARIRIPALVGNPLNDPFVPAASLPRVEPPGSWVRLWQPAHGGHVGFPHGSFPGHVLSLPQVVGSWLAKI